MASLCHLYEYGPDGGAVMLDARWRWSDVRGVELDVQKEKCRRYRLEVDADAAKCKPIVIQVKWNGEWSAHRDIMKDHLTITDVTAEAPRQDPLQT